MNFNPSPVKSPERDKRQNVKTILIATKRDGGKDVVLAGTDVPVSEQKAQRDKLFSEGSDEYIKAGVFYLTPCYCDVLLPLSRNKKNKSESKSMKKLTSTLTALLLLAASSAFSQSAAVPLTMPTQTIAAGEVTNVLQVIDVTKQASVAVQASIKQSGAGTNGPIHFVFDWSTDREKWSTATKTASFAATGLTENVCVTNIPTYGARFMRLKSVQNADSATITNITVNYAVKVGAP